MVAREDIQFQGDCASSPGSILHSFEECAAESPSAPGLDNLDVVEECNILCPTRVVETHPGPADGLFVDIDASKDKHPLCLQPLREELCVLVASTLHRSFWFPSTSSDLLDRVLLRDRRLPLVKLCRSHLSDSHLRHGAILTRL